MGLGTWGFHFCSRTLYAIQLLGRQIDYITWCLTLDPLNKFGLSAQPGEHLLGTSSSDPGGLRVPQPDIAVDFLGSDIEPSPRAGTSTTTALHPRLRAGRASVPTRPKHHQHD